jgi:biotin/methionine sulfoxide reductase
VRVYNNRGACLAGLEIDAGVAPGVVVMATGAWYDPDDTPDRPLERHGNANVLSFDAGTSKLAQGPSALSALVEVEAHGAAPPVGVFHPPVLVSARA